MIEIRCQGATTVDIKELKPLQGKLKKLSTVNYEKLKREILETGFSEPISVWNDNGAFRILNGHQRLATLKKLAEEGHTIPQIPISLVEAADIDEAKRKVLALTSQYGEMTNEGLFEFIEGSNIDLDMLTENFRFPEIDTEAFLTEHFPSEPTDDSKDDIVPEVDEKLVNVKLGDIWILGNHRLICGDSTDKVTIDRLMCGEKADMVFTDPPYGVSYTDKNEFLNRIGDGNRLTNPIKNDHLTVPGMYELWCKVFNIIGEKLALKSSFYICSPQGGELMMMMMQAINQSPLSLKHSLIWVKNNHVLGRCDYNYKHEPILYGWLKKGTHEFIGKGFCKTSVWEFDKPNANKLHPTMKPISLIVEAILNSSLDNGKVLDLFGGSGSTLIACEKTNRRCFMSEIDPHYCQVIIDRWEEYTGKQAFKADK